MQDDETLELHETVGDNEYGQADDGGGQTTMNSKGEANAENQRGQFSEGGPSTGNSLSDNGTAHLDDSIEFVGEYIDLDGPVQPALKVKKEVVVVPKAKSYKLEPESDPDPDQHDVKQDILLPISITMPTAMKCEQPSQPPQPTDSSIDQSKIKIYHYFIY